MKRGTGFVVCIALALAMAVSLAAQTVSVSRTAVVAASLRAIGSRHPDPSFRNPDRLAIEFIGARERALLTEFPVEALDLNYAEALARLSPQDRASVTSMFLRTKHPDAALDEAVRAGTRQVIILGAGFDSRGYRFSDRSYAELATMYAQGPDGTSPLPALAGDHILAESRWRKCLQL